MTNEVVVNKIDCFQVDGDQDNSVSAQSILPDISTFELIGKDLKNGQKCQKWQKKEKIGAKVNKYTMWLRFDAGVAIPVHYEMKGYNTLLGSHYDHYYLSYHDFRAEVLDDSHVFDLFLKKECHGWPGPGMDHTYTMNPMKVGLINKGLVHRNVCRSLLRTTTLTSATALRSSRRNIRGTSRLRSTSGG